MLPIAPLRPAFAPPLASLASGAAQPMAPSDSVTISHASPEAICTSSLGVLERRTLRKAVERIGSDNVGRLVDAGVRLEIIDDLTSPVPSMLACYIPERKLLRIAPGRFDADTLVHELGHALDDLAEADGPDGPVLKSEKDDRLKSFYAAYKARVEAMSWWEKLLHRGMWSDYATTSPQEYVADAVMDFTAGSRRRSRLERCDPDAYGYVRDLLGQC